MKKTQNHWAIGTPNWEWHEHALSPKLEKATCSVLYVQTSYCHLNTCKIAQHAHSTYPTLLNTALCEDRKVHTVIQWHLLVRAICGVIFLVSECHVYCHSQCFVSSVGRQKKMTVRLCLEILWRCVVCLKAQVRWNVKGTIDTMIRLLFGGFVVLCQILSFSTVFHLISFIAY